MTVFTRVIKYAYWSEYQDFQKLSGHFNIQLTFLHEMNSYLNIGEEWDVG